MIIYPQSIIYYVVRCPKLQQWLCDTAIKSSLELCNAENYSDCDPTFTHKIDEDYDICLSGISRDSFCNCYLGWIQHCAGCREQVGNSHAWKKLGIWESHFLEILSLEGNLCNFEVKFIIKMAISVLF